MKLQYFEDVLEFTRDQMNWITINDFLTFSTDQYTH